MIFQIFHVWAWLDKAQKHILAHLIRNVLADWDENASFGTQGLKCLFQNNLIKILFFGANFNKRIFDLLHENILAHFDRNNPTMGWLERDCDGGREGGEKKSAAGEAESRFRVQQTSLDVIVYMHHLQHKESSYPTTMQKPVKEKLRQRKGVSIRESWPAIRERWEGRSRQRRSSHRYDLGVAQFWVIYVLGLVLNETFQFNTS